MKQRAKSPAEFAIRQYNGEDLEKIRNNVMKKYRVDKCLMAINKTNEEVTTIH